MGKCDPSPILRQSQARNRRKVLEKPKQTNLQRRA